MLKIINVLFFFLVLPSTALSGECLGPKSASNFAVYLHGMDTVSPGSLELSNRRKLSAIADKLNIRIGLPRATDSCPNDKKLICWGWDFNDPKIIDAALAAATKTKAECFPKAKMVGLIGFSNGGFVANQIVKDCKKSEFSWLISIGAAGSWNSTTAADLSQCGQLKLMAGKLDKSNYENIKKLAAWFRKNKAHVDLIEYDDDHSIPAKELEQELKKILAE